MQIGGLSCLPLTFQHVSTSKGEFNESGPLVVHKRFFSALCFLIVHGERSSPCDSSHSTLAFPFFFLKKEKNKHGQTRNKTDDFKSKFACILEASESTRLRMEESLPNNHEDHMAGKGDNSLQHHNLVHKFIPMPQAMKIPAAKAAVVKEWEKLEKIPAWDLTKVRSKSEVIGKDEGRKSSICLTDGHLSFEECRIGGKAPKI